MGVARAAAGRTLSAEARESVNLQSATFQGSDEQLHGERRAHVRGFPPPARRHGRQHTEEYRDDYEGG